MDTLTTWFEGLDPTLRIYWGIAIFSSMIFAIQLAFTLIGIGGDASGDVDADFDLGDGSADSDGLDGNGAGHLISIRGIVNFLLGLGWGGVCFWHTISNHILLHLAAIITGVVFMSFFFYVIKQMMKLEANGAYNVHEAVGKVCDVYLRIPANASGQGKVQISFNGSVQELAAQTEGDAIPSGQKVRVVKVIDATTLLVERI